MKRGNRLLPNGKSRRAAVQAPAPSVMLDDGTVKPRVRLVRPLQRPSIVVDALAAAWQQTGADTVVLAWETELAPLFTSRESTLHVVTGLLLPIGRQRPSHGDHVYPLPTDEGERVIGRQVSLAWVPAAFAIGPALCPVDAFAVLMRRMILQLADGLGLRRIKVMNAYHIELTGLTRAMRKRLSAYGLFHEIAWKLRMYVPTDAHGAEVLAKRRERYPLQRLAVRQVA